MAADPMNCHTAMATTGGHRRELANIQNMGGWTNRPD